MPTVLRIGALRVAVYPNDHRPAHVHVIGQGQEAVFVLNCMAGPAILRENYGFAAHEIARLQSILQENLTILCRAWKEIHGTR
jgi:hypothetical protein